MSLVPDDGQAPEDHDRRRLATTRRIVLVGALLGLLAALGVALLGATGAAGLATTLLVWALTAAVAGLHALAVGFVDDLRRRPVSRRRVLTGLGLLAVSLPLLLMASGAVR